MDEEEEAVEDLPAQKWSWWIPVILTFRLFSDITEAWMRLFENFACNVACNVIYKDNQRAFHADVAKDIDSIK